MLPRDNGNDWASVALRRQDGKDVGALGEDDSGGHAVAVQVGQSLLHRFWHFVVSGGENECVSPFANGPGDCGEDGGHAVGKSSSQKDPDGPRGSRCQQTGGKIRLVPQCLDRGQYLLTRLRADRRVVVEHAGDGLRRDSDRVSHVTEGHACGHKGNIAALPQCSGILAGSRSEK